MGVELWRRAREIFELMVELPEEERGAALAEATAADEELREAVASLLAADADERLRDEALAPSAPAGSSSARDGEAALAEAGYLEAELLGRGGMGEVWKARASEGEEVAVKLIRAEVRGLRPLIDRFLREARIGMTIDDPRVVRTRSIRELRVGDQLVLLIEMALLRGRSLSALLQEEGALPPARVRAIALDVARGLVAVHAAGVVHRDIKPANLHVGEDGVTRILDLGVARLEHAEVSLTVTGSPVGTPAYAAPEQLSRERRPIDGRADLYALGLVMRRALAGRLPHDDLPPGEAVLRKKERLPPVEAVAGELPSWLAELVAALTEPELEARPASAAEVVACLEQARAPTRSWALAPQGAGLEPARAQASGARSMSWSERLLDLRLRLRALWAGDLGAEVRAATRERERAVLDRFLDGEGGVGPHPDASRLYLDALDAPRAALRIRSWEPGAIPPAIAKRYELAYFPLHRERAVAELTLRIGDPGELHAEGLAKDLTALMVAAWRAEVAPQVELAFCAAPPSALEPLMSLGWRPYGARLISTRHGLRVPMVLLPSDLSHLRGRRSALYPELRRLRPGPSPPEVDPAPLREALARRPAGAYVGEAQVLEALERARSIGRGSTKHLLARLSERSVRRLAASGAVVLDVAQGVELRSAAAPTEDLFLVLRGRLGVSEERSLSYTLGVGQILGAEPFFRLPGSSATSAHALQKSKVLALRRADLERLVEADAVFGLEMVRAMARSMGESLRTQEQASRARAKVVYEMSSRRRGELRPAPGQPPLVLAVDDDPYYRMAVAAALRPLEAEVTTAEDGDVAILSILERRPDVVVADVDMPKIDGIFLCQLLRLREETRDIPFVFLSSKTEQLEDALRLGGDDFISKPFRPEELRAIVRHRLKGVRGGSASKPAEAGGLPRGRS